MGSIGGTRRDTNRNQTRLPPKTRQPKPRTHAHHARDGQPPHVPHPRHERINEQTAPPREPRPQGAHKRDPRALGRHARREQGLRGRGVVGLEDAVGLVEADCDADGEEAGEEDEGLPAGGYGAEAFWRSGGGGGGGVWGGGGRGVVRGEFGF
jgi:hypothetical protein